jgi:hypothetical protein
MAIKYKGPVPEAPPPAETAHPVPESRPSRAPVPARKAPRLSPFGLVLAFASTAGLAGCITLLYQGMAFIMETEGGFVAVGGPYEIAHPAPEWVLLIPLSIMGLFAFGGLSISLDGRGMGMSLVLPGWVALFVALGWNFLRLGLVNPPEGLQGAWGWILSGVVFWIMGLGPAFIAVRGFIRDGAEAFEWSRSYMTFHLNPPPIAPVYLVIQLIGAAAGVAGGIALFAILG